MGWATIWIERLKLGEAITCRPRGNSMRPLIESGDLCTVLPVEPAKLVVGDIVLCRVRGREYLHLIKAINDGHYQIGNNHGGINGWITAEAIFGKMVVVSTFFYGDK